MLSIMIPIEKLLNNLSKLAKSKNFKFKRLYSYLYNPGFYNFFNQDELDLKLLENLTEELKTQKFQPDFYKKNKIIKDQLIFNSINLLLETIYKPIFININSNPHKIINSIVKEFAESVWFIRISVYPEIDINYLINILEKRIEDNRFLNLIRKFYNHNFFNNWKWNKTFSGVPISQEKDELYLEILLNSFENEFLTHLKNDYINLFSDDNSFKKDFVFKRYKNEILLGITGSKQDAKTIEQTIKNYLTSQLGFTLINSELSYSKTGIEFLNYLIKKDKTYNKVNIKIPKGKIKIEAREKKLVKDFSSKQWMPIHRPWMIEKSDLEIIQRYNTELKSFYRYYSIADNVSYILNSYAYLMEYSCLKTLANKHKTSLNKFRKKHATGYKRWGIKNIDGSFENFYRGFRKKPISLSKTIDLKPYA